MNRMNFHRIEREDLVACLDLFVMVFNAAPWNETWEVETVRQRLEDYYHTPGSYGLLVENQEKPIGFALGCIERWDKAPYFYLKEMCVAPEHQRSGVGTSLMNALQTDLKNQGIGKLYLHTARDTLAQSFYEKQGFSASDRMIMMSKWLDLKDDHR